MASCLPSLCPFTFLPAPLSAEHPHSVYQPLLPECQLRGTEPLFGSRLHPHHLEQPCPKQARDRCESDDGACDRWCPVGVTGGFQVLTYQAPLGTVMLPPP